MANLSKQQFDALVALLSGPKSSKELAGIINVGELSVRRMMYALRDRGLITPTGKRRTNTQAPKNFTYQLTNAGRLQAQQTTGAA